MSYKLTEQDRKILNLFSKFILSHGVSTAEVYFDVSTDNEIYFDFSDRWTSDESSLIIRGYEQITKFVEKLIHEELQDYFLNFYDYEDRGAVYIIINAKEKELTFRAIIYKMQVEYDSFAREFVELNTESKTYLDNLGITHKRGVITYEGGGDSGYISNNLVLDGEDEESYPEVLENDLYSMLSNFGGWENNEGGQGEFTIYFKDRVIVVEHGTNYESSEELNIPLRYSF